MPAEKFYLRGQIQGDEQPPDITITWGTDHDGGSSALIVIDGEKKLPLATPDNIVGMSRLIQALSRARTHMVQNKQSGRIELPDFLKGDQTRQRRPEPEPAPEPIVEAPEV